MARKLKKNEELVEIGRAALRAPDGSMMPSVPMYIVAAAQPQGQPTEEETELIDQIGGIFAAKFAKYVRESQEAAI